MIKNDSFYRKNMNKRSIDDFIEGEIDFTITQTKKKLEDIFSSTRKYENDEIDEESRVDWIPLMRDVLEIYKNRHKKKLAASHLIPSKFFFLIVRKAKAKKILTFCFQNSMETIYYRISGFHQGRW